MFNYPSLEINTVLKMVLIYNELSRKAITVLCKSREDSLCYQELFNISLNHFIDGNMLEAGDSPPQHLRVCVSTCACVDRCRPAT